jgi:hypothetical protein
LFLTRFLDLDPVTARSATIDTVTALFAINLSQLLGAAMIKDGIDGVLILTDDDENLKEIAARFTRETGRPVWRELTEIPR